MFLVSFVNSQNDIIVNQHHQNLFAVNASYSNLLANTEANLYYKKLWAGFSDSPEFIQLTLAGQ